MCGFGCLKQFDICNVCGTHHTLAILTDITPSIFKNACQYLLLYIQKAQPNQCIVHYTLSFCSASTFIIGRCICWVGKSGQCIPLLLYLSIFFPYEQTCPLENTYDNYDPQGNIIFFANSGLTRSLLFGGQSSYSYSISLKWEHNTYSLISLVVVYVHMMNLPTLYEPIKSDMARWREMRGIKLKRFMKNRRSQS